MRPVKPTLTTQQIQDVYIRKNFEQLVDYFKNQNQLLDFKPMTYTFTKAQDDVAVAHGLPYIPDDIIVSKIVGPGVVTFEYAEFDATNIYLSATDACTIRFMVGTYFTVDPSTSPGSSDAMAFAALIAQTANASGNPMVSGNERIGTIFMWPSETVPADCLPCRNQYVKISDYPLLYNVLGTQHGPLAGGGTLFALPKTQGLVPRGWDPSKIYDVDAGTRLAAMNGGPQGNHVGTIQMHNMATHRHGTTVVGHGQNGGGVPGQMRGDNGDTAVGGIQVYTELIDFTPGADTRPSNFSTQFIIKAK